MADPTSPTTPLPDDLLAALEEAARLGYLGPGPMRFHVEQSRRLAAALRPTPLVIDLGSGGGVPGLVLAGLYPELRVVLLDASTNRTDFLARAVRRLGWDDRVEVLPARADDAGRSARWRGRSPAVVARSFGPPSATVEAAAPLLALGGQLVVSEPPDGEPAAETERWPAAGLALVGLRRDADRSDGAASFTQVAPCPERFPRRRQRPPLFAVVPRETPTNT